MSSEADLKKNNESEWKLNLSKAANMQVTRMTSKLLWSRRGSGFKERKKKHCNF